MATSAPATPAPASPGPLVTAPAKTVKKTAVATKNSASAAAAVVKPPKKTAAQSVAVSKTKALVAKKAATKSVKTPAAAAPDREAKAKKPKLVRDSFTIPKDEYAVIESLKQRSAALAQPVKKSELLRAGLKVLAALSDTALRSALKAVPSIKTGRPKAQPETVGQASIAKKATKATPK